MRKPLFDLRSLALLAIVSTLAVIPVTVSAPRTAAQEQKIHIEVDLINILASVTDRESRPHPQSPCQRV